MLRRADVAMYHAKRSSDQSAQFYDDGIDQTAKEDFLIERALRAAIEMPDELDILFQPMVSARTGQFVKAEALARWHSKTIGHVSRLCCVIQLTNGSPLSPDGFIPRLS
jgi:predicted signal transduction protein with EAL and GGDEF domain